LRPLGDEMMMSTSPVCAKMGNSFSGEDGEVVW
jgi:hypothetical protein